MLERFWYPIPYDPLSAVAREVGLHSPAAADSCQLYDDMLELFFQLEPQLGVAEFVDLLRRSTLAERRPVDDLATIAGMLANADLIVTARTAEGLLVGVSRAITDFSFCTYLSDLAVDVAFQRRGIGQELIRRTHAAAGLQTSLILLAAPQAEGYYPHIGMQPHHSCWRIPGIPQPPAN